MKDKHDKQTADLLASAGASRQAAYAQRQRAQGRRQIALWVTDTEAQTLRDYLNKLRSNQTDDTPPKAQVGEA